MNGRRSALVRKGLQLNYFTLAYNACEAAVSIGAGLVAGSVALVGFGVDSVIEVSAGLAALSRLRADVDPVHRELVEQVTRKLIGASLLTLAGYVAIDSVATLWTHEAPEASTVGLVILLLSVAVMPALARAKRRIAHQLGSRALEAESAQTSLCAYLSMIALAGVALNAALGWWWADPAAGLAMVPIIGSEGLDGLRGHACSDEGCSQT